MDEKGNDEFSSGFAPFVRADGDMTLREGGSIAIVAGGNADISEGGAGFLVAGGDVHVDDSLLADVLEPFGGVQTELDAL